jgi:hypothetical protein
VTNLLLDWFAAAAGIALIVMLLAYLLAVAPA